AKTSAPITEEEVKHLLTEGMSTGTFNKTERELIHGVFDFADTIARQVMTPRTDIEGIPSDAVAEEILSTVTTSRYSRLPVYEESLDNIVGIIHARDVIGILREKNLVILHDIIRKPFFIPDSKPVPELLRDFQRTQSHLAIVLDEFGGTAGLVTLEDLLEEIVGEIQDEYDKERQEWIRAKDGSLSVAADMIVEDFNEEFKAGLPTGDFDTIGGMIVEHLGRLPRGGESTEIDDFRFIVTEREGNRIRRFRVIKLEKPSETNDSSDTPEKED
ncbi:MAG: HlyC/CorC family transporter, partial [candidate division Zixibacteria bacterium]|nr:HlyC/CorC family transporter [candidate division Zixibacteria bacterium]